MTEERLQCQRAGDRAAVAGLCRPCHCHCGRTEAARLATLFQLVSFIARVSCQNGEQPPFPVVHATPVASFFLRVLLSSLELTDLRDSK